MTSDAPSRTPNAWEGLTLESFETVGLIDVFDRHLARTLGRIGGERRDEVLLAAALVSQHTRRGHVCLDLERLCASGWPFPDEGGEARELPPCPPLAVWREALESSPLVGRGTALAPLVLDTRDRVYLGRLWHHQEGLARAIRARIDAAPRNWDEAWLREELDRLFPAASGVPDAPPDRQREAVERAARYPFCVISGGPGTGKTFTVVKILALFAADALRRGIAVPHVRLAAPTGKAAARLVESIRAAKQKMGLPQVVLEAITEEASTLHRLLGATGDTLRPYRRDASSPIAADLVVIDEASMVDLAMMARLFDALRPETGLILLGDKDQLTSVEAGSVLGDMASAAVAMGQRFTVLDRSYRNRGGIARVAEAIRAMGEDAAQRESGIEAVLGILRDRELDDIEWIELGEGRAARTRMRAPLVAGFAGAFDAATDAQRLDALDRFRVLCAHRDGDLGVAGMNAFVARALHEAGRLALPSEGLFDRDEAKASDRYYAGRPILITRNDYDLGLFNGDLGVVVEREPGVYQVLFRAAGGAPRAVGVSRLPSHETAFAMSVHKSQGSEIDEVAIVLPEQPSPVLARELLYTAITRAKKKVVLYGSEAIVRDALSRRIERDSGLRDALQIDR